MDFDVLFTVLFWAAGLSLVFWVGLLLAGLVGEVSKEDSDRTDGRGLLSRRDFTA